VRGFGSLTGYARTSSVLASHSTFASPAGPALCRSSCGYCSISGDACSSLENLKFPIFHRSRAQSQTLIRSPVPRASTYAVVGRLGFEPRQTASKAVDLPLVDRPVIAGALPTFAGKLLCEHRIPVSSSRQGFRKDCPCSAGLHTILSCYRRRLRPIESKQRRSGS
jgi:hypothetical protein